MPYLFALILILTSLSYNAPANAGFFTYGSTPNPVHRDVKHFHPYQWGNSSEGLDFALIDSNQIINHALKNDIIRRITIEGDVGYVEIDKNFFKLSLRDQRLLSYSIDGLYKARKGFDYGVFFLHDRFGKKIGSYSKYGLDVY